MVIGPDFTTTAKPEQFDEIDALLRAAFGQSDEAELVQRLRANGEMWNESVKPWNGVIAGYAALSRMQAPEGWACLAPVAVLPSMQNAAAAPATSDGGNYHIGTRLVQELAGLTELDGHAGLPSTIVVLGEPGFYQRAGFSLERARNLTSPYPIEYTLIARPGDDVPEETLVYPSAFNEL